jgi:hypothetical protein
MHLLIWKDELGDLLACEPSNLRLQVQADAQA